MKIVKAVKGRKEQRGKYVVTVLVDEAELLDLAPEQFNEMKMAISHTTSLEKEALKWIDAYRAMEGEDLLKS